MPGFLDAIDSWLTRRFRVAAACVLLLIALSALVQDARRPMWVDELYTLNVARQPSVPAIIQAIRARADNAPPLYPLLVHYLLPLTANDALAVRLPSTLGFLAMAACVLAFARRRLPASYALAACLLVTVAASYYATEGRVYALLLAAASGALVAWQAAAAERNRTLAVPLLALCLALTTAMHYFAIFFLLPLAAGEFLRWRSRNRIDWPVVLAMVASPLMLAMHLPLILLMRNFARQVQVGPSFRQIPDYFLRVGGIFIPFLVAAALLLAAGPAIAAARKTFAPHEWAAITTLALSPAFVIAISKYTTRVFVDRYAVYALIGLALFTTGVVCMSAVHRPAVGAVLLALVALVFLSTFIRPLRAAPQLRFAEAERQELEKLPDGTEPILVGSGPVFMELAYYVSPRLRLRLVFPYDSELELRYTGADAAALLVPASAGLANLRALKLADALRLSPRFFLTSSGDDYLPSHLISIGCAVSVVSPRLLAASCPSAKP